MSAESKKPSSGNVMIKVATFIVDKRNLFFLLFAIGIIFSLFSKNWVNVENALSAYLPETSQTSRGLSLMGEEFVTYGTAKVMVQNISYDEAEELCSDITDLDYISMVQFDSTTSHYNNFSALYDVTFLYSEDDERCLTDLDQLKEYLKDYDIYVSTEMGDQSSETIASEMQFITVIVAIIVLAVLIFTSDSYAEVPILVITFLASSFLADGTNFLLGTISFVSDSVAVVLQLALSVDYAVIFCNQYKDERKRNDAHTAVILALSKAIVSITASSLTTVGGLIAMCFMQFGIGPDLAIVLIKAIVLSLLSVFLLMPGLLMVFSGLMEKTTHKSFVPKIPFVGKFAYATRFIVPFLFVAVLAGAFYCQKNTPYVYGYSQLEVSKKSDQDIIDETIEDTFGTTNMVALIVPGNDYDTEAKLLAELDSRKEVKSSTGLANTEAMNGVMLTEKLNAREFAELVDVDQDMAKLLYAAYAINDENYAKLINGFSTYSVPFIDMIMFLYDEVQDGYVTLDDDKAEIVNSAYNQITVARNQLQGENYDRMLIYLNLPEEGDETFAFLDEIVSIGKKYYGDDANVLVCGNATSEYDLKQTFETDNTVVTYVSILAVLVVLLFTFKSAGMPVLLILIIEGCIWMNFSFPYLMHKNLFFMGYLIVSSIQMGANIDYAIVVSSRYQEVKHSMSRRDAIIDTMNFAFPTIVTSGTMLAMAGILIGMLTSEPCICGIGECLGRGTIISIFTVLFILPQVLLVGDHIIDKTSFDVTLALPVNAVNRSGLVTINGPVQGRINGEIVGTVHAVVRGEVELKSLNSTSIESEKENLTESETENEAGKEEEKS